MGDPHTPPDIRRGRGCLRRRPHPNPDRGRRAGAASSRAAGLRLALQNGDPALCLLTATRSLARKEVVSCVHALAADLAAAQQVRRPGLNVSCSDSTLRRHFPGEVDPLAEVIGGQPPLLLIPYFGEGGRLTLDDVHCVRECSQLVPSTQTPLATGPPFGYRHSRLGEWVGERIAGRVPACSVASLPAEVMRQEGTAAARSWLAALRHRQVGIVNPAEDRDLEVLAVAVHTLEGSGLRFHSAAAWVKVLAGPEDPPSVDPASRVSPSAGGGVTVVGSLVRRTNDLLAAFRQLAGLARVELMAGGAWRPKVGTPRSSACSKR